MASEKQIEANQKNSKWSTGPKTEEGKAVSRLNGLDHGLRTRCVDVLPHEDYALFAKRLELWHYEFQPSSDLVAFLVRQAAILSWKIERAEHYELARLAAKFKDAIDPCFSDPLPDPDVLNALFLKEADLASFDASHEGERIRRYQFSLQRALDRILARIAKIRADEAKGLWGRIDPDEDETPEAPGVESVTDCEGPATEPAEFSTTEPNFEDVLQEAADRLAPIKANSAAVAPVSFHVVPKRTFDRREESSRTAADPFEYVDISCLKL